MVTLGEADGKAAVTAGREESENTAHFFALKKTHDKRVKGVNYEQFKEMKANGIFGDNYRLKEDKMFQALFLQ